MRTPSFDSEASVTHHSRSHHFLTLCTDNKLHFAPLDDNIQVLPSPTCRVSDMLC